MQETRELYMGDDGTWKLAKHIVRCRQDGEIFEQYTDDVAWFHSFEEQWVGFEVVEVIDIEYTESQLSRLTEVQGVKPLHFEEIYDYVLNGIIKVDSQIFTVKNVYLLNQSVNEQSEIIADILGGAY